MSEAMGITYALSAFAVANLDSGNPYFCGIKDNYSGMEVKNMDLIKIGSEIAKEHEMTIEQSQNEVHYKMSIKFLDILKRKGIVSDVEYAQIDELNRQSFSPCLAKVYV
ncbi:SHOCT domain-containing protein [Inediibacterium massiliense]|uniref:SHOCT domain-containing protein n=1 Tax=Inediibacterium massiliense TaxID=1658111 RepID=UPI0006B53BEA|nr:SHOCT domain-containing protein [Inediibacterium massiliense]